MNGAATPAPLAGLGLYLIALAVLRVHELRRSARHTRALLVRGAREHGASHFPLLVALHAGWPLMLVWEVLWAGARPPAWWPAALVVVAAAALLRRASMQALGELWTARIVVLPSHPDVRAGVHGWLAHPSYVAVTLELIAAPLLFGAWRTALAASAVNALALAIRIPAERAARAAAGR